MGQISLRRSRRTSAGAPARSGRTLAGWTPAAVVVSVALALVATGCGGSGRPDASGSVSTTSPTPEPAATGTITVYAAQSLTNAFTEIRAAFEKLHPGASVKFNFNGSSTLVTQITQGAPADIFASADQANMDKVVSAGLASATPQVFTKNLLQIVVAAGNPKKIGGLADLDNPGVSVDLCGPTVPCGNYARQALAKAGITVTPVSSEQNVTAVVARVANGEADAGIVYRTDVLAAGSKVAGVDIPAEHNVVADYPIATLKGSPNPTAAEVFGRFVQSAAGQAILAKHGFVPR